MIEAKPMFRLGSSHHSPTMHLPEEQDAPIQVNIVPMIDVIFAVLVFFLISSLYLTRSQPQLPVTLPSAATGEEGPTVNTLTVVIQASGEIFLGQQPTSLDTLATAIEARRVGTQPLVVVIRADTVVPHGRVVAVMDRLRAIAGVEIGIAVAPEGL